MANVNQMKRLIALRGRLTGLAYYPKAVFKQDFGAIQCPVYGPHMCVFSSQCREKDTLFHSYHPQSVSAVSRKEFFMTETVTVQSF